MNKANESFLVLFFDVKNCLTYAEELFRGTLSQTSIYTGDVLKAALDHNAASVMLGQFTPATDYLLNVNFFKCDFEKTVHGDITLYRKSDHQYLEAG